jgi:hypothetical protein
MLSRITDIPGVWTLVEGTDIVLALLDKSIQLSLLLK